MDGWLRQSTAVTVPIGPFVDSTDGDTEETALTIAQADVRLTKNGAASAQKNNATSASHDADGVYLCPLSTTDTNTLGQLVLWVHVAGALFAKHTFHVVPANIWDSFFSTDLLDVSVVQFNGTNGTFSSGRPEVNATHWGGTAVASAFVRSTLEQILGTTVTEGAAGRIAAAFQTFFNVASSTLTTAGINQTGDSFARIGANGVSLSAIPDEAGVTTLLARLTATRAGYIDNLSAGAVAQASALATVAGYIDTEVAGLVTDMATVLSRLSAARAGYLDNLSAGAVAQASALSTVAGYIDTEVASLVTDMATVLSRLSALRAGYLDNLSAGAVALDSTVSKAAALTTAQTDLTTLVGRLTSARAGYLDNLSAGAVALVSAIVTAQADLDDIQTRLPAALVGGRMDSNVSALNNSNAAAIRLALASGQIIPFTVDHSAFTATTSEFESDDLATATADFWNTRLVLFTSGALAGQIASISDYARVGSNGHFTISTVTSAPADNVTGVIL